MKYLCQICAEGRYMMENLAPDEARKHFGEYREFTEGLQAGGHLIACNRLVPPDQAVTVRVRNGKAWTTDGPYAETKEQLGGFFLIEAADLNAAIEIAARIPGARYGSVEVRQIAEDALTLDALAAANTLRAPRGQ